MLSGGRIKSFVRKTSFFLFLDVEESDATKFLGGMLDRVDPRQDDGLVGTHPGRLVDGLGIDAATPQVRLGPCDEEGEAKRKGMKSFEVEIPPIHHVMRSRFGN